MSKKTQILCVLTTMIFGVALFIATSYKTSYADEVEGVYQVYLNGEKLGMINSQDELYSLINDEQSNLKEEYNVNQVYPPKGFSITKLNTYNSDVTSVNESMIRLKNQIVLQLRVILLRLLVKKMMKIRYLLRLMF